MLERIFRNLQGRLVSIINRITMVTGYHISDVLRSHNRYCKIRMFSHKKSLLSLIMLCYKSLNWSTFPFSVTMYIFITLWWIETISVIGMVSPIILMLLCNTLMVVHISSKVDNIINLTTKESLLIMDLPHTLVTRGFGGLDATTPRVRFCSR